jgi:hypothetical protein
MSICRKLLISIGGCTVVASFLLLGCGGGRSMGPARPLEAGQRGRGPSVLVATQGSPYKEAVTRGLVARLEPRPAHLQVVDVSELPPVRERDWDALVVMFSWERWRPEPHARAFIEKCSNPGKLVVLTTSGSGDRRMAGVDAVTSASELVRVDADAAELARRVEAILQTRGPAPAR